MGFSGGSFLSACARAGQEFLFSWLDSFFFSWCAANGRRGPPLLGSFFLRLCLLDRTLFPPPPSPPPPSSFASLFQQLYRREIPLAEFLLAFTFHAVSQPACSFLAFFPRVRSPRWRRNNIFSLFPLYPRFVCGPLLVLIFGLESDLYSARL